MEGDTVATSKRRFGHGRSASLFQTLSALTGGGNTAGTDRSAGSSRDDGNKKTAMTYGSKKKNAHRSVLVQSHRDLQLWDTAVDRKRASSGSMGSQHRRDDSSSATNTTAAPNRLSIPIDKSGRGTGLGIDLSSPDLDKENTPGDEFKSMDPSLTPSKRNSTLSRMARALSTLSNASSASSKATVDMSTTKAKRASKASSVSTIQRFSIVSLNSDVDDTGSGAHDTSGSSMRRSMAITGNMSSILRDNDSTASFEDADRTSIGGESTGAGGRRAVEIHAAASSTPVVEHFAIPMNRDFNSGGTADSSPRPHIFSDPSSSLSSGSSSSVLGAPSASHNIAGSPAELNSSPSTSSILSFKRDPSKNRKKVDKSKISLPTGMVDPYAHFGGSPMLNAGQHPHGSGRPQPRPSQDSLRSVHEPRRPVHKKSTSSFLSSGFLSLRGHRSRDEVRGNSSTSTAGSNANSHSRKMSVNLGNTFSKKSSISDMRKSILAFSPSSSSLLSRLGSPSDASCSGDGTFDKSMISLPVPVEESREKLRNKLRASTSLLSLTPSEASATGAGLTVGVPVAEYTQARMEQLLSLCSYNQAMPFDDFIESVSAAGDLRKLAEASFSEVFIQDDPATGASKIYKVIPFGEEELDQLPVQDIIQELTIARMLTKEEGFVKVLGSLVVQGRYPQTLLDKWDEFAANSNNHSENYRPDSFDDGQRFCVIVFANGGTDLEHYDLDTWHEASAIFWQVVKHLARAEEKFEFEHRDLHWGNILISNGGPSPNDRRASATTNEDDNLDLALGDLSLSDDIKVTLIDYTLSRATAADGRTVFTRLDHPDFFRGKGDYQFDIYRFMRNHVSSQPGHHHAHAPAASPSLYSLPSGSSTSISSQVHDGTNWALFCPKTNVMWLHYVADKLVNGKDLQKVSATKRGRLSFGGGSNTSLRDAYLSGTIDANEEATACHNLETIHRSLDPRKKRFGKRRGSEMYFQDFASARDVLSWGIKSKLVPS